MLKKLFFALLLATCVLPALTAADLPALNNLLPMGAAKNILDEREEVKDLILKYASAPAAQKPALRRSLEQLEQQQEAARQKAAEDRLKRQEAKIKTLKQELETRRKNTKTAVSKRVEYLLSTASQSALKQEAQKKTKK